MSYSNWKGSTPYEEGCRFAVWAPNADDVFVVGAFNNWDKTADRMSKNENGSWSIDVPGARPGDLEGAIDRLAYLKELGINAVEIMPVAECAGGYSWGYNPSNPRSFTIAEDLQNNPYMTKAQNDGGAGFSTQWAAPFVHAVRKALIGAEDAHRDMDAVRNAILHRYHLNAFERVIYTESHDEVSNGKARIPEEVDPGKASSWAAKKKSSLGVRRIVRLNSDGKYYDSGFWGLRQVHDTRKSNRQGWFIGAGRSQCCSL